MLRWKNIYTFKRYNNILESAKNINLNLPISGLVKNMYKDLAKMDMQVKIIVLYI